MRLATAAVFLTFCVSAALPAPTGGRGTLAPAPVGGGAITPAPAPGTGVGLPEVISPDLVIKQVVISREGGMFGHFGQWRYSLTVANVGNQVAGPSTTALVALRVSAEQSGSPVSMEVKCEIATPAIPAGDQAVVTFQEPAYRLQGSCVFAMADFPTLVAPSGAVREIGEGNNVLVVPLARVRDGDASRYVFE